MNTERVSLNHLKLPTNPPPMITLVLHFNDILRRFFTSSRSGTQSNELREYESESVQKTLDNSYVPKPILEARKIQDEIIKKRFFGKDIAIADIGCGDGYHGEIFAPECKTYHGFEISSEMAEKTRKKWAEQGLENAKVFHGDASCIELDTDTYDVAWSLYFTSGNFRDELEDVELYDDSYLDKNPAFIKIVSNFYESLKPGGKLFLTVYKDRPETEEAQHTFYKNTGQTVVTPLGYRFVATEENFWSVRFTKKSMLSNLAECGIEASQVQFNDLNDVAWLVEVTK